jgi:FkbM family methyltransferase
LRTVGHSGRVVAFEPQPEMAEAIRRMQERFDWANLEVLNVALSDAEGTLNLARDRIGDGSASLEASRHRAGQDRRELPAILDGVRSSVVLPVQPSCPGANSPWPDRERRAI